MKKVTAVTATSNETASDRQPLDRRYFLELCSAAGVGGTLLPGVLWARLQQEEPPTAITSEVIEQAEQIAGLELTAEERELMRNGLARNLRFYRALRELQIPNDIPPALLFEPAMPGVKVPETGKDSSNDDASAVAAPKTSRPVPRDAEELAFATVAELSSWLVRGELSSVALTELYLERLERYDPKLLCVVNLTRDLALRQARAADRELRAGRVRGPLHGIPWGAKDLLAVRGYPTTWGAAPFENRTLDRDATVVSKLEEAGAVLVAKLALGALAMGDVWFGGRTRNPWHTKQGSSGSSAGPGAATAAGCVGFSIGTETRGSIVSPATRNGVTGLRPTFGRVSRTGAMALSWSMDKIGPMCRSAEDCALVFAAIEGADGIDPSARDAPFEWRPERPLRELRVGYLEKAFDLADRYTSRDQDLETLRVLTKELMLDLAPVELPEFPIDAVGFMLSAEAAAAFDSLTRSGLDDQLTRQDGGAWPNLFRTSRFIPAVEYIQASRARTMYMRLFSQALEEVDVVVAPTFRAGIVGATNLTGHPCVVVPNGFSDEGRPTSITFLAGLYREEDALRVAHAYQQKTDFHQRRPDLDNQPTASE